MKLISQYNFDDLYIGQKIKTYTGEEGEIVRIDSLKYALFSRNKNMESPIKQYCMQYDNNKEIKEDDKKYIYPILIYNYKDNCLEAIKIENIKEIVPKEKKSFFQRFITWCK